MSILFIRATSSSLGRDTAMLQVAASMLFHSTPQIGANGCSYTAFAKIIQSPKSSQRQQLIGNELVFDRIETQ